MTLDEKKIERYITKDSGARQQFDSGMVRDTSDGKTDFALVFNGPMLERWAELLTRGEVKYPPDEDGRANWMRAEGPAELSRFRKSAARHFAQWMRGDTDEDHAAACFFNLNGAEYVKQKLRDAVFAAIHHKQAQKFAEDFPDGPPDHPVIRTEHRATVDPLRAFWDSQGEWSQATFGTDVERGPIGSLKHLAEEVLVELLGCGNGILDHVGHAVGHTTPDIYNIDEYADCLTLIFDAARRAGFTFEQLVKATLEKHETNKARKWEKAAPGEPSHHVKGAP